MQNFTYYAPTEVIFGKNAEETTKGLGAGANEVVGEQAARESKDEIEKILRDTDMLFITAGMLISMKVFFALTLMAYGVFFIPFALISIFILIPNNYKKPVCIVTLCCAFILGIKNVQALIKKDVKISTSQGVVYSERNYGEPVNQLIKYIETKTAPSDRVVIYPECLLVNYMTGRLKLVPTPTSARRSSRPSRKVCGRKCRIRGTKSRTGRTHGSTITTRSAPRRSP